MKVVLPLDLILRAEVRMKCHLTDRSIHRAYRFRRFDVYEELMRCRNGAHPKHPSCFRVNDVNVRFACPADKKRQYHCGTVSLRSQEILFMNDH